MVLTRNGQMTFDFDGIFDKPETGERIIFFGRNFDDPSSDALFIINRHPSRIEGRFSVSVITLKGPQILESDEAKELGVGWGSETYWSAINPERR